MDEHRCEVAYNMIRDGEATVSEVANLLGTTRQRVAHWCKVGFNPGRFSRTKTPIDAKAARQQWLNYVFAVRLKETPRTKRGTIRNARAVADEMMASERRRLRQQRRKHHARGS